MNVEKLRETYPELLAYMENEGYYKPYVDDVGRESIRIIESAERKGWTSYDDIYQEYERKLKSPQSLRKKRTILRLIERFERSGQYPNGNIHQRGGSVSVEGGKYHLLTDSFKAILEYHFAAAGNRGKKDTTILGESRNAAQFLYMLQKKGIETTRAITEDAVISVFAGADGKPRYSCSYKKSVSSVFRECIPQDPEIFSRILTFFPALRMSRKNIQYLEPEEITALKQVLGDENPQLSLRDKAIGLLALHTGLRSCDIAGLTMESIDWEKELILINQQKTDVPLVLPLTAAVGNAIYDYLVSERPETEIEHIFVSENRPHTRLQSMGLNGISHKIMVAAGIRQSEGDRRGFHIFRHHLATALLGGGVARPVISQVLGHISPDSIDPYLSADFVHLRKCALSVVRFPVGEGVFANA